MLTLAMAGLLAIGSSASPATKIVTFQLRDWSGRVVRTQRVTIPANCDDLTLTQLLVRVSPEDAKQQASFYYLGHVMRYDAKSETYSEFCRGAFDGKNSKLRAGQLQDRDIIVLQKEAF